MSLAGRGERDPLLPELPGRLPRIVQIGELLLLLEGVHAPELVVPVAEELALGDEPVERRIDELVAGPDVVEDLPPQADAPRVDDHVRLAHGADPAYLPRSFQVHAVACLP